jgi:hypothetical protein
VSQVSQVLHEGVIYRHIILTVPAMFHIPPNLVVRDLCPSRSPCNCAGIPPCWVISCTDHLT